MLPIPKNKTGSEITWTNWAESQFCWPKGILQPKSLDELQSMMRKAHADAVPMRAVGTRHAWSPIVPTQGYLIDVTGLNRWLGQGDDWIEVEAGILTREMNQRLAPMGRMVQGLPIYQGMSLGGMVATGSHGSGLRQGSLSDQVIEMTVIRPDGERVRITADQAAWLRAAKISMGTLGVVYSLKLRTLPAHSMRARDVVMPFEKGLNRMLEFAEKYEHVSVYHIPYTGMMWFYIAEPSDERVTFNRVRQIQTTVHQYFWFRGLTSLIGAVYRRWPDSTYPLLRMGKGVLRNTDSVRHSQHAYHYLATFPSLLDSEYTLPYERAEEAYRVMVRYVDEFRSKGLFPINMALHARFVKGSDAYLSPTAGRDSVCIEAATGANCGYTAGFYSALAECFMGEFDARPHWGKGLYNLPMVRQQYQGVLAEFNAVREKFDPEGIMMNLAMNTLLK